MKQFLCTVLVLISVSPVLKAEVKVDMEMVKELFSPIDHNSLINRSKNKEIIELGKELYFEKKLSVNNKLSCNSCHDIEKFGVDNEATSPGHEGKRGDRNSPSSFNAGFHIAQFWDGRSKDLADQALGPILNPVEMGMKSDKEVLEKIKGDYLEKFKAAFKTDKEPYSYKNLGKAIAAYEMTLVTPSRFDEFLKGKKNALTDKEKVGLNKFIEVGCTSCHNGPAIGGNSYQQLGLVNDYKTEDLGRYNVTKSDEDKKVFKVPSLRNVEKTFPYFHDGSVKTLEEAIKLMAYHQLDVKLDKKSVSQIKDFLKALTADIKK